MRLLRGLKSLSVRLLAGAVLIGLAGPANAVVGGAVVRDAAGLRSSTVQVETSRGELCSGAAIAPDLVLTAAHCLMGGGAVSVTSLDRRFRPRIHEVAAVLPHPSFVPGTTPRSQPGIDLALLRLARPLPADVEPLALSDGELRRGDPVTLAGFGLASETNKKTARTLREVTLVNAGTYTTANIVQVAVDRRQLGENPGAGACRGDSGGPVLRGGRDSRDLVGIVSWSSGPLNMSGRPRICGGFTAITPIREHHAWIEEASLRLLNFAARTTGQQFVEPQAGFSWWPGR